MEIDIQNLHHAYLILGNKSDTDNFIGTLFNKLDVKPIGNPDIFIWDGEKFGIEEARSLKERADSKAFGSKKLFLIASASITPEAQNALLKVFEEPTSNTHFFILSKINHLLPTLLSRLNVIDLHSRITKSQDVEQFLRSDVAKRLDFVKEKINDEGFNLSDFLEKLLITIKDKEGLSQEISKIYTLLKYANDPAKNTRMILEHLALTLPLRLE